METPKMFYASPNGQHVRPRHTPATVQQARFVQQRKAVDCYNGGLPFVANSPKSDLFPQTPWGFARTPGRV
jgi:hypothetical protein